jgi:hypothetical protein
MHGLGLSAPPLAKAVTSTLQPLFLDLTLNLTLTTDELTYLLPQGPPPKLHPAPFKAALPTEPPEKVFRY